MGLRLRRNYFLLLELDPMNMQAAGAVTLKSFSETASMSETLTRVFISGAVANYGGVGQRRRWLKHGTRSTTR